MPACSINPVFPPPRPPPPLVLVAKKVTLSLSARSPAMKPAFKLPNVSSKPLSALDKVKAHVLKDSAPPKVLSPRAHVDAHPNARWGLTESP